MLRLEATVVLCRISLELFTRSPSFFHGTEHLSHILSTAGRPKKGAQVLRNMAG